jgi:hypothetical protein
MIVLKFLSVLFFLSVLPFFLDHALISRLSEENRFKKWWRRNIIGGEEWGE